MTDIAALGLYIDSSGVVRANKELRELSSNSDRAETGTKKLGASFTRIIGPIAAVATAMSAINKLVSDGRQFGIMSASLETVTGSTEKANAAFSNLVKFASETPYALEQSVEAFIKLKTLGLDPSEEALRSYGNTAAAMGKDLTQLIEAVADASVGEFERLKEFGIKAKSEGDNVSFTFQGVTTTIKKNSEEIQQYLKAIGENNFGSAMAKRMETLDGAISNFGDTWDELFRNVLNSGVGNLIQEGFLLATEGLKKFMDLTGLATEPVQVINEITDAAIKYGQQLIEIENIESRLSSTRKARQQLVDNLNKAMAHEIAARTKGTENEIALELIRNSVQIKYNNLINKATADFDKNSQLEKSQLREAIALREEAIQKVREMTAAQQEQDAVKAVDVTVMFDNSILAENFDERIDYLKEHNLIVLETIKEHNRLVADEEKAAYYARMSIASSMLGALSALVDGESHKQFNAAKNLAKAEVVISTIASAQKAYESMIQFGPWTAAAAATAAGLAGLARYRQIDSQQFRSSSPAGVSGGGGGGGGSQSFYRNEQPAAPAQQTSINIYLGDEKLATVVASGLTKAIDGDHIILQDGGTFNRVQVAR